MRNYGIPNLSLASNIFRNNLKDLSGPSRTEIQDPFLIVANNDELGRNVSPVQLACKSGLPEKILPVIEMTKCKRYFSTINVYF